MKKHKIFLILLLFLVGCTGNGRDSSSNSESDFGDSTTISQSETIPTTISIDQSNFSLVIGETRQLTYSISPSDNSLTPNWQSSNNTIVSVSDFGLVSALKVGSATITVKLSNTIFSSVTVTVTEVQPTSFLIDQDDFELTVGETKALQVTLIPENAQTVITWQSTNTTIATVNSAGVVRALKAGKALISATTANNLTDNVQVTINNIPPTSFTINGGDFELNIGETKTLTYTLQPAESQDIISWHSSNSTVASIDINGIVSALSIGSSILTGTTSNGLTSNVSITVVDTLPTSISINEGDFSINNNQTKQLTYTLLPAHAITTLTWESSNTSIATVSQNGLVTAKSVGSATITVMTHNSISSSVIITVLAVEIQPTLVTISGGNIGLEIEDTHILSASVLPSNATNKTVVWSSSNTSVATVTSTGLVRGIKEGMANITAQTSNGITDVIRVAVRYGVGDYEVNEIEPNNTTGTADFISRNGTTIYGRNSSKTSDIDHFRFSLTKNDLFGFIFTSEYSVDLPYYLIGLMTPANEFIAVALPSSSGETLMLATNIPATGTYYLVIMYSSESPYSNGAQYLGYAFWE